MTSDDVPTLFRDAMASLASGVAVITAKRTDDHPCGLAATSVASYSAMPPSVLVSVAHDSRCHDALAHGEHFGVHILRADQEPVARVFAGKGDDKFGGLNWDWDDEVPRLLDAVAYLRCRRSKTFEHYDHTVLIGDIEAGRVNGGDPLVWLRREFLD